MKTQNPCSEEALLRDVEALAPMVKDGFARMEGPSAHVLKAIHEEAVAQSFRRRSRSRFFMYMRVSAAAALFLITCGISMQTWRSWHHEQNRNQAVQILRMTAQGTTADHELADTGELASFLLNMQGLDRDSYFSSPDEVEALWL